MNSLIKQYIDKLTINNINDFARKNNIDLSKSELNVLYDLAKNHYEDLLAGNDAPVKAKLKETLSPENYDKVMALYDEYRKRYQGYLW